MTCLKAFTSSHWSRGWFSKAGLLVFFICPRGLGTTGAVWESHHTPSPLARLHPIVCPPGVLTQAGPPSVLVTHCSPLYCNGPRFIMAALGHLVLQRLPPVSEEGSFTKLGSMICPFVSCISCSTSCDVTD